MGAKGVETEAPKTLRGGTLCPPSPLGVKFGEGAAPYCFLPRRESGRRYVDLVDLGCPSRVKSFWFKVAAVFLEINRRRISAPKVNNFVI